MPYPIYHPRESKSPYPQLMSELEAWPFPRDPHTLFAGHGYLDTEVYTHGAFENPSINKPVRKWCLETLLYVPRLWVHNCNLFIDEDNVTYHNAALVLISFNTNADAMLFKFAYHR